MLDVPDENYINADHFCEQPLQDAVAYAPFRDFIPEVEAVEFVPGVAQLVEVIEDLANSIEGVAPAAFVAQVEAVEHQDEVAVRPATMPVRHQPEVHANQCLKHYLTQIYQKRLI